jgi:mannose-6-phosphate isomerase-like protein (cupin superfamily)
MLHIPSDRAQWHSPPWALRGQRRITWENDVLFAHLHLVEGDAIPAHSHPWPSLYYVVAGRLRLLADDGWQDTAAGALLMTPPGVDHGIEASEDADLIEVQSNCPRSFFERVVAGLTIADLLGDPADAS